MPELAQKAIRILLIDDHALFREGLARLLAYDPEFEVAAACASIEEGLAFLTQGPIDIVLLDSCLGERNGKEFLRLSREQDFSGKVLLVTAGVNEGDAAELIRAGISGIFLKRDSPGLLAQAIRHVVGGGVWFKQEQLENVINSGAPVLSEVKNDRFTKREQQVLSCVFNGFTNQRIAEQIGVSTGSVKSTLQQLFSKTGVRTRSQLVRIVLEQYKDRL